MQCICFFWLHSHVPPNLAAGGAATHGVCRGAALSCPLPVPPPPPCPPPPCGPGSRATPPPLSRCPPGPHRSAAGRRLQAAGHFPLGPDALGASQPLRRDPVSVGRGLRPLPWGSHGPGARTGQRQGPPVHQPRRQVPAAGSGSLQPALGPSADRCWRRTALTSRAARVWKGSCSSRRRGRVRVSFRLAKWGPPRRGGGPSGRGRPPGKGDEASAPEPVACRSRREP